MSKGKSSLPRKSASCGACSKPLTDDVYASPPTPLSNLLKLSGEASILIVLVLAAQWVCGRRLQPAWRCALWLLVVLRLALPWTIPSPTSLFNLVKLPETSPVPSIETAAPGFVESPDAEPQSRALALASPRVHWLVWLWAAGALGLAGGVAVNHFTIRRRVAGQRPITDGSILNLLEDCKALMGVTTPVTLLETTAVHTPTLFGFVRPRLLLPAGLASHFTRDELRHIFLHELAHIKRYDVLACWITLALQTVHWFNPLVWLAFHRLRADRELACDALALSRAHPGENQAYGFTIVKLLERFGQSVWAPSLAGILEKKQQLRERIDMIAKFHNTNHGRALAICLFAGLGLVTLTDQQSGGIAAEPARASAPKGNRAGAPGWSLQEKLNLAESGNQWAAYDLWDAYYRGNHGIQPDPAEADKWLGKVVKDLWVVRFEPVGDFAPSNPGEFLERINKYSPCRSGQTNIGAASFFRTTAQGDKLVGSFLSNYPDQLKAGLAKVPGVRVTSTERMTPEQFVKYERSQQESIWVLEQKIKQAEAGNDWAAYDLWQAYSRGEHGLQADPSNAGKWLGRLVQNLWVVRFETAGDFSPRNPGEFLQRINQHSPLRSGTTKIGAASFFRTTKQGDRLVGSFLTNFPDQLKASLAKVPGLQVTSSEQITAEEFIKYEKSPQESL